MNEENSVIIQLNNSVYVVKVVVWALLGYSVCFRMVSSVKESTIQSV